MGQKVNPHGLRVGVIKDWDSKWYAEADFADLLVEDYNIRTYLKKKLLESAIANAENNNGMSVENLYIEECYANKGPTMKRIRPRAQGRAYRIEKRMSHITLVLNER